MKVKEIKTMCNILYHANQYLITYAQNNELCYFDYDKLMDMSEDVLQAREMLLYMLDLVEI